MRLNPEKCTFGNWANGFDINDIKSNPDKYDLIIKKNFPTAKKI